MFGSVTAACCSCGSSRTERANLHFSALVGMAVDVVGLFMALLSFVESIPRAYRLKASNAAPPFSTSIGTNSRNFLPHHHEMRFDCLLE
jgi:hypothetical protein